MKAVKKIEDGVERFFAVDELCELTPCCVAGFAVFTRESGNTTPDFIDENGTCYFDGSPLICENLDVKKTNDLMRERGNLEFDCWDFLFYSGTYWTGRNWKLLIFDDSSNLL